MNTKEGNGFFKNVRIYFREYCTHTSVHGFQYFGEKNRHIFERFWWIIIFLVCLATCIFSIHAVYTKWEGSPVIVNFANKGTPIYEIPFPAVTICPESKTDQEKFNFTDVMQKKEDGELLNLTETVHFDYMSLICNYYPELNYSQNYNFSDEFYETIDDVRPRFLVFNCIFMSTPFKHCELLFTPIITDEGVCYTFNMLQRNEIFRDSVLHFNNYHTQTGIAQSMEFNNNTWTLQDGYVKDLGMAVYPMRAFVAGASNGFTVNILTPKKDLDYACKNSPQGDRVMLHTPMTIPRPSQRYFRVPLDQSVVGAVQPVMITTSQRIKTYSPVRRGCYFSAERPLKYFKNYTSSNCNLECLTNYTLEVCGCVNFFMPRENGTAICGTNNIECMKQAESLMYTVSLGHKIEHLEVEMPDCNCLPVCADLTYEADTSQTNWDWKKGFQARRSSLQIDDDQLHLSSLTLFFKSEVFITSERNEFYGPIDFLANFGGLLGLFTGFSILSLMEILYFMSIRIVCNLRLFGQWAGVTP